MLRRRLTTAAASVFLVLAVAACDMAPYEEITPESRYPLAVETRTFATVVPFAGPATLPEDFLVEYRRRGEGPVLLTAPPGAEGQALARRLAASLRDRLIDVDVDTSRYMRDGVEASWRGAVAIVPTCGDWSDGTIKNPSRLPPVNFGCAYRRNLGLMVADPRDLEGADPLGAAHARRPVDVLEKYGRGLPTATMPPQTEASGVTGIGGQ